MGLTGDQVVRELPGLTRYALTLTRDRVAAEDLVQESVLHALERADSFRGESSPATWLHRVLYHRFVDGLRRRRIEPVEDEVLAEAVEEAWRDDAYTVDAPTVLERAETRDTLYDALVHLPVHYRSAVVLHDVEGMTAGEVAEVCGVGVSAAKQRIRRGRAMVVTALAGGVDRRREEVRVPMRCWQARSRISDYLDDELSADDRQLLERHLEGCPTCPALYAGIVGITAALGQLRDPDSVVPTGLAQRIRHRLAGSD